ncbi:MAG: protein kinase [Hyphomicrobium sp.]|jgi:serine/threonine protein kinase
MAYQQTLPVDAELIGDFRVIGVLGSGGFANTYLALDLTLGREVAIKEFFPSDLAVRADSQHVSVKSGAQQEQFDWALGRFVREAKTLAKFRHPSVVRVFRVFNANETAYIVLEFVRGANMESWLKRLQRRPTQAELDSVLRPLLEALEVVHGAGILHRDIKPANIYIREADQAPVLLDFGAAKYASGLAGDYAGTTAAIVSKGYSPNEAYSSDSRQQGPWTDLYGLAATLYRALTGRAPPESTMRMLQDEAHRLAEFPVLSGHYRPEFLAAIDAALNVMPRDRPQSVAAWSTQLFSAACEAGVVPAVPSGPARSGTSPPATSKPEWHPLSDNPSDAATVYSNPTPSGGKGTSQPATSEPSPSRPGAAVPVPSSEQSAPRPRSLSGPIIVGRSKPILARGGVDLAPQSSITTPATQIRVPGFVLDTRLLGGSVLVLAAVALLAVEWLPPSRSGQGGSGRREATEVAPATTATERKSADELARQEREAVRRRAEADARSRQAAEERFKREETLAAEAKLREDERLEALAAAERARKEQEAAEAARLKQEAEEARKNAEKVAEEQRQRTEREAQERKRQEDERARVAAEAERARKAKEAAEAERIRKEKEIAEAARLKQQAEEARKAEEVRRKAERLAEEQRLIAEREAQERKRQEEERARVAAETERLRKEKEAEAARVKAAEDEARRKEAETQQSTVLSGQAADAGSKVAALTPPLSNWDRTRYVSRVQEALKRGDCYKGALDGDIPATSAALGRLASSLKSEPKPLNLAQATVSDYDDWLTWFDSLRSFSCERPPELGKPDPKPTDVAPKPHREQAPPPRAKPAPAKQQSAPRPRSAPSGGGGGGDLLRGGR